MCLIWGIMRRKTHVPLILRTFGPPIPRLAHPPSFIGPSSGLFACFFHGPAAFDAVA